jgi:hypothetical protein
MHAQLSSFMFVLLNVFVCFYVFASGCRGDTAALAVAHFPPEPLCNKRGKSGCSQGK